MSVPLIALTLVHDVKAAKLTKADKFLAGDYTSVGCGAADNPVDIWESGHLNMVGRFEPGRAPSGGTFQHFDARALSATATSRVRKPI